MTLTVEFDLSAKNRTRIITAASATIDGTLRFVATSRGRAAFDYYMPYVRLSPTAVRTEGRVAADRLQPRHQKPATHRGICDRWPSRSAH